MEFPRLTRGDDSSASSTLRAFAVLEQIATSDESLTLEELTRISALPKPTVHRILRLLMRGGMVERQALDKRYVVGPRVSALALAVQMRSPHRRERRAILARLVETIGETCNFTMLDGSEVVYLDRVETSAGVRLHMDAGSRVPLHCTASGKLLLSALPNRNRCGDYSGPGPLRATPIAQIQASSVLESELAKIRASGVGIDVGEYLVGSVCMAVPVRDSQGRMCAAVAVHGPAPRMTLKKGHTFLPAMRRAADEIAATLSARGMGAQPTTHQEARPTGGMAA